MFDLDPAALSVAARVDALVESEREIVRMQARQVRATHLPHRLHPRHVRAPRQ
jgi:hypothetical protein